MPNQPTDPEIERLYKEWDEQWIAGRSTFTKEQCFKEGCRAALARPAATEEERMVASLKETVGNLVAAGAIKPAATPIDSTEVPPETEVTVDNYRDVFVRVPAATDADADADWDLVIDALDTAKLRLEQSRQTNAKPSEGIGAHNKVYAAIDAVRRLRRSAPPAATNPALEAGPQSIQDGDSFDPDGRRIIHTPPPNQFELDRWAYKLTAFKEEQNEN